MKFFAISFNTSILNDIRHYSNNIEIHAINPHDFLNQSESDNSKYYINLVTQDFELRKQISQHLTALSNNRFSVVHENSCVEGSEIGDGSFIYPNVTLYPESTIGQDVIVQANSRVSHNSNVGDGCFIGGLVNISGSTEVGRYNKIYPCCNIVDKISICDDVVIGTGSTLRKSIRESGTYSELPNKIRKLNKL
jgi:acetyltransferase-like isoleucine patch superfamily enzyme